MELLLIYGRSNCENIWKTYWRILFVSEIVWIEYNIYFHTYSFYLHTEPLKPTKIRCMAINDGHRHAQWNLIEYAYKYIYNFYLYYATDQNSMGCGSSSTADPKSGKPQNQTSTRQENRVRENKVTPTKPRDLKLNFEDFQQIDEHARKEKK